MIAAVVTGVTGTGVTVMGVTAVMTGVFDTEMVTGGLAAGVTEMFFTACAGTGGPYKCGAVAVEGTGGNSIVATCEASVVCSFVMVAGPERQSQPASAA